jgi:hypothetical protein
MGFIMLLIRKEIIKNKMAYVSLIFKIACNLGEIASYLGESAYLKSIFYQ